MELSAGSRFCQPIKWLLIVTIGVYFLQIIPGTDRFLLDWGKLVPYAVFARGQLWRLLTYMFLHDPVSPFHLLFNMLALWMFGKEIEQRWGAARFMRFYFISGVGSGCFSVFHLFSPVMRLTGVIGASGAILALLTVYAYYYPHRKVLLFFILPVNIRVVVIGYALFSLFGSIAPRGVVAHLTHLGGILIAIGYLRWYPLVSGWLQRRSSLRDEGIMRLNAEAAARKRRFFEEQVDPILEKISREGKDSLSPQEKKILKKASESKERDQIKKRKIIPFDIFR